jgi:hypothetical protein
MFTTTRGKLYTIKVTIAPPIDLENSKDESFDRADLSTAQAIVRAEDTARAYDARKAAEEAGKIPEPHDGSECPCYVQPDYVCDKDEGAEIPEAPPRDVFTLERSSFPEPFENLMCEHLRLSARRECMTGNCYVMTHGRRCHQTKREMGRKGGLGGSLNR